MVVPVQREHRARGRFSVNYSDEKIFFERIDSLSIAQKVSIKVTPDCRVEVRAPVDASDASVIAAVRLRARWIYKQLQDFSSLLEHIRPRQYVSGESHLYLGKQYVLKVIEDKAGPPKVKLLRGKLEVTVREKQAEAVRQALAAWYKVRARETFGRRLEAIVGQTLWVDSLPPLRILTMKTQWGSCSSSGLLMLNPHLVKAPMDCIDYVILHELCHLAEHNHSERFYRLMTQIMPTWEKTKVRLDDMANALLAAKI